MRGIDKEEKKWVGGKCTCVCVCVCVRDVNGTEDCNCTGQSEVI
jgi:hypothetical protein